LKKAAMNILVKMAENKDINNLKEAFIAMDLDGTGDIKADELK
jgi:Ca2+-binding EF-hand superfamily protein